MLANIDNIARGIVTTTPEEMDEIIRKEKHGERYTFAGGSFFELMSFMLEVFVVQ